MNKVLTLIPRFAEKLVRDNRGGVSWLAMLLFTTIVVIGSVAGLNTYRGHLLQQFGDAAVALRNVRQSYSFNVAIDANRDGDVLDPGDCVLTGTFTDTVDLLDDVNDAPACMVMDVGALGEAP